MKETERKNNYLYTEGNTALQIPEAWEEDDELAPKRVSRQVLKNRAVHKAIPLKLVVLFGVMTVLILISAVRYVRVTADINRSLKMISNMQAELSRLKTDNLLSAERMEAEIDLEEVYQVATEKLGMVYPDANERVTYIAHEREYVRQYEDIPTD